MIKYIYLLFTAVIFAIYYIFFLPPLFSETLTLFFKVIPMICFIVFVALTDRGSNDAYKKWLLIGLIFCTIGDVTLRWFIFGLSSFLIGHIFYIIAFLQIKKVPTPKTATLLLLLFGIVICGWVVGNIIKSGDLLLSVAVITYIAIILTMAWASFQTASLTVIFGALFFLLSDSILALNRFVTDIHYSSFLIMSTYYTAQILFTISVSKHFANRKKMLE
ncbi:lysoplasmalogenase [Kurthia sibirica]|uniref:Lysoplasmalogenase n=1 Tax=Kurthia sibirica TaxID=202750 RepID=A0A2U3AQ14_9BACL|nr:lysoplasmalogenase [Kurthia sibirica]PWI26614.1 lysoplasmalogenase [Kurthia sibirica]GEK32871.1 membrane protein [Kurthia sibirica]